jgi:hypothetical protein
MLKFMKTQTTPAAAPTASDLQARLDDAKAALAQLTADHAQAAYDSIMGVPDAVERHDALAVELAAAAKLIGTLEAAITVAKAREAEAARQRRVEGQKAQIERVTAILHRRAKYAQQLTEAISDAVKAFRLLADNSVRAGIAFPGGDAPLGAMFGPGQIQKLVAAETYRQGGVPPLSADPMPSFPGAHVADTYLVGQPDKIPLLLDAIKAANDYAIASMRGQTPTDWVAADPVATDPIEETEMAEAIPTGPTIDATTYVPVKVRMA